MNSLHVHDHGPADAPVLVLVHGLTDDGTCWPDAVARWQDRWRVVTVDQRGHGQSPRFAEDQFERAAEVFVEDLAEVLRGLGSPAILVGHSLGGIVSARTAGAYPELVQALVLEDPAKPGPRWAELQAEFSQQQLAFVSAVTDDPEGEKARMRRETTWSDAELAPWAEAKARVDRDYLRLGLNLGDTAWESMFDALTVPTLIVVPVGGDMAPNPDLIANPLVSVVPLEGVGHCIRRDDPAAFHGVVDPFLEANR